MTTHDCHVLMQQLIPIAIRGLLPENVRKVVIQLCNFYRSICARKFNAQDLSSMEERAINILCELEKVFPPSFFTVMVHLTVHLAREVILGGPVFCRWMYPTERYMFTLKSYVRNRSHPEGSIAEGYLAQECMDFCSSYLDNSDTRTNRPMRNQDDQQQPIEPTFPSLPQPGEMLGSYSLISLTTMERDKEHRYVLFNCDLVQPYIK